MFASAAPDSYRLSMASGDLLEPSDLFAPRHIGPRDREIVEMLSAIGCGSLEDLARETVPEAIRLSEPLALPGLEGRSPGEHGLLELSLIHI